MIGSTMSRPLESSSSSSPRAWRPRCSRPSSTPSRWSRGTGSAGDEPFAHLLAAAELLDELRVEPRLVDAQPRVRHQAVAVEPLDVVALVGGAVAPDVDAVLLHRADEHRARHRATEGRRVEVRLAAGGADVEGAGLQGDEALFHEGALRVDQAGDLRAVLVGATRDGVDVRLVVLADVGRVRAGHRSFLTHPGNGAGGVETPENAMPTRSPTGRLLRTLDTASIVRGVSRYIDPTLSATPQRPEVPWRDSNPNRFLRTELLFH